ncbi:uncharacterized protein LOC107836369 [Poecilia formosa]|uniref:uncharacterized protein LOC107836369 n=1 Tax=Poecilia formosa TaxID=48698 RepID=UPI0007B7F65A|nr:PREDICTED: uncharacterized protein LOC107836369 [Poecilia formosa]
MDQCEDRQEGVSPSKTSLCLEQESLSDPQRRDQEDESQVERRGDPKFESFKSNKSNDFFINFNSDLRSKSERKHVHSEDQQKSDVPTDQSAPCYQTQLDSVLMLLQENVITFVKNEMKNIQKVLTSENSECLKDLSDDENMVGHDEEQWKHKEALFNIIVHFMRKMEQGELADNLQRKFSGTILQRNLKSSLKKKFQCVFEGIPKAGNPTFLNQIYTELHIIQGGSGEVNKEHEVRQIETVSMKPQRPETTIRQEDIFKLSPGRVEPIRTVMTQGVAGIGKTKEEYFRKRFTDEKEANRIIFHMKGSQSLHIMCHIPVFCWITATVLEDVLKTKEDGDLPKTLTEMYIHFLVVETKVKKVNCRKEI